MAFHCRHALAGGAYFERDLHLYWYGQVECFVRAVASASWPVWNPLAGFGEPLWANPAAQVLYPPLWLNLVMLPTTYYTLNVVGHLLLAGFGASRLARQLGVSEAGAFVSGGLWTLSGPLLSSVNHYNLLTSAAWMPCVLLAQERALDAPTKRAIARWALAMAVQACSGSPELSGLTVMLGLGLAARRLHFRSPAHAENRPVLGAIALAGVLSLLLTAAQWLPAAELVPRTQRAYLTGEARGYWSLPPALSLQMVMPVILTRLPLRPEVSAALHEGRDAFYASLYLGLPALPLVAAAILGPRRPGRGPWAAAALLALLVAYGRYLPVHAWLVEMFPPARLVRFPMKLTYVVALGWSMLAGMGWDAWWQERLRGRRLWICGGLLVAGVCATLAGAMLLAGPWADRLVRVPGAIPAATLTMPLARQLGLTAAFGVAVAALWGLRGRLGTYAAPVAAALLLADLSIAHGWLNPTMPREMLSTPPALLQAAAPSDGSRLFVYDYKKLATAERHLGTASPYRVPHRGGDPAVHTAAALRAYLLPTGASWGLRGSFERSLQEMETPYSADLRQALLTIEDRPELPRLLQIVGVGRVVSLHPFPQLVPLAVLPSPFVFPIHVYAVPEPLPRVFAVSGARIASDARAFDVLLSGDFDPRGEVVLPPDGASAQAQPASPGPEPASVLDSRPDRVRVHVDLSRDGHVVLGDSYDPNWQATVDGHPAAVVRANVGFCAVSVPAGSHVVEFRYRPASVRLGLAASAVGLIVVAMLLFPLSRPSTSAS